MCVNFCVSSDMHDMKILYGFFLIVTATPNFVTDATPLWFVFDPCDKMSRAVSVIEFRNKLEKPIKHLLKKYLPDLCVIVCQVVHCPCALKSDTSGVQNNIFKQVSHTV